MQTRPTVRPTKAVLQRAAVDTALQFQNLLQNVVESRFTLQEIVLGYQKQKTTPKEDGNDDDYFVYFVDYNSPMAAKRKS